MPDPSEVQIRWLGVPVLTVSMVGSRRDGEDHSRVWFGLLLSLPAPRCIYEVASGVDLSD